MTKSAAELLPFKAGRVSRESFPLDVDVETARRSLTMMQLHEGAPRVAEIVYPITQEFDRVRAIFIVAKLASGGTIFSATGGTIRLPHGGGWSKLWDERTRRIYNTTFLAWCEACGFRWIAGWYFQGGRLIGVPLPVDGHKAAPPAIDGVAERLARGYAPRPKCSFCDLIVAHDPRVRAQNKCWDCPVSVDG